MKKIIHWLVCPLFVIACSNNDGKEEIKQIATAIPKDSITEERFMFVGSKDSVVKNGEQIKRYKNGVIEKQGMMKNGKRDGLWKSYYEDGTPWSETTFKEGIKDGKTTTWYPNGQKRYDGFYTNDNQSGKWIYYDEKGNITNSTVY